MPRYEVRLEAQDAFREDGSPHFRLTTLEAPDEAAAIAACERAEYRRAAYRLDPGDLARLEDIEADPEQELAGQEKAQLYTHRQAKPYLVVSVTELPGRSGEEG